MIKSILNYIVCPVCLGDLELDEERRVNGEVIKGRLACQKCEHIYTIQGGIPILTPPGVKPYDWLSKELTWALKQVNPRKAVQMIAEGKIKPKKVSCDEPVLTQEELEEGEYKDSENFLRDRFGSIKGAREHFRRQLDENRKFFDVMIRMGMLDESDVILDVGTGYGYMLQYLAEHLKSTRIFSIDISYTNLKAVRGRFRIFGIKRDIHLVAADALHSPFRNNQFDAVESWAGYGNIVGFSGLFSEAHRILRNQGWFVTDVMEGLESVDRDLRILIKTVGEEFFIRNFRRLGLIPRKDEIVEAMKGCGFRKISSKKINSTHIIWGQKTV